MSFQKPWQATRGIQLEGLQEKWLAEGGCECSELRTEALQNEAAELRVGTGRP